MNHLTFSRGMLSLALAALLAAGCEKTEPNLAVEGPGPVSEEEKKPAEPELKPLDSVEPILEVQKTAGKLLITGHFRSYYQEQDMIRILSHNFPDYEVVSELDVGKHVKRVGAWGNRVSSVLVPLFRDTGDNCRFHFEKGVVTIEGTVANPQTGKALHQQTVYFMEDVTVTAIEVNLEVAK